MKLNELTPGLKEKLAPTDCRLRPDQRATENGEYDLVSAALSPGGRAAHAYHMFSNFPGLLNASGLTDTCLHAVHSSLDSNLCQDGFIGAATESHHPDTASEQPCLARRHSRLHATCITEID